MSCLARQRLITTLMLIASLLFQQVAMAAYVCAMPPMQSESVVMAKHCAGMETVPAQQPDTVCQKHCVPDPTSADTFSMPLVQPLALPPVMHALAPVLQTSDIALSDVFTRAHPPPRLRYCRLLI